MPANLQLPAAAPSDLTNAEAQYVYNVEALGLPVKKAAGLAGLPVSATAHPHVMEARQRMREQLRGNVAISKEDVLFGIKEAIDRAKVLAEPATEILGWKQISTMLGYDAPSKIDVHMKASVEAVHQHVRLLPDAQLVELVGAGSVIDGEFYRVDKA